jgi:hypothetical protein
MDRRFVPATRKVARLQQLMALYSGEFCSISRLESRLEISNAWIFTGLYNFLFFAAVPQLKKLWIIKRSQLIREL